MIRDHYAAYCSQYWRDGLEGVAGAAKITPATFGKSVTRTDRISGKHVVPSLRYRNVAVAINWLCAAFGFGRHSVQKGDDGGIIYAALKYRDALIMIGSVRDSDFDQLMRQPDEVGGVETQCCYVVVKSADVHYARAKAAGAEILLDLSDDEHGGRSYVCRDIEGHIWSFGTFDPAPAAEPLPEGTISPSRAAGQSPRRLMLSHALIAAAAMAAIGALTVPVLNTLREDASTSVAETVAQERAARLSAEQAAKDAEQALAREHAARDEAEKRASSFEEGLARERQEKEAANSAARNASEAAVRERSTDEAGDRSISETRIEPPHARETTRRAEEALAAARVELDRETLARRSAEQAQGRAQEQLNEARKTEEAAQRNARQDRALLHEEQIARERAEQGARDALEQVSRERTLRENAERLVQQLSKLSAKSQAGKEKVLRANRSTAKYSAENAQSSEAPMPSFLRQP